MVRNIWLLVVSLIIGPAIGGTVFFAFGTITDAVITHGSGQDASKFLANTWPIFLIAAYTLGMIPATVSAIIMMFVIGFFRLRWQRLVVGTAIGALVSAIAIAVVIFSDAAASVDDFIIISGLAITGGVSAFFCVGLMELWQPLPKHPETPAPAA